MTGAFSFLSAEQLESLRAAIEAEIATAETNEKPGWLHIDGIRQLPGPFDRFLYQISLSTPRADASKST